MANTTNLDLVKPAGTDQALISVLNGNSDKIDQFAGETNSSLGSLADGLAIVANGDVHGAISSGQYVYVRNHTTLAEGLYTATSAIAANASLSTSNLTADSDGGFNSLSQAIAKLDEEKLQYVKLGLANGVQQTFTFPSNETIFAMIVTRTNVSSTSAEGIFIGGTGSNNSHITAIGTAASNLTVSMSGNTLTMTSSTSNMRAIIVYA